MAAGARGQKQTCSSAGERPSGARYLTGAHGNGASGKDSTALLCSPGVIALFCRQYDIIKDNEPNNNKEKTKSASETSTPEHQGGGLLRSKVRARLGCGWAAPWLTPRESLDHRRGQLRAWCGYSWAEPSLATACVTQGTLQIDFGSFAFVGCQGPVGVK